MEAALICLLGWGLGVVTRPAWRALAARRGPVNLIDGKVFPHPADDEWMAIEPTVFRNGKLTLELRFGYDCERWFTLHAADVEIARGRAVKRYYQAVCTHWNDGLREHALMLAGVS